MQRTYAYTLMMAGFVAAFALCSPSAHAGEEMDVFDKFPAVQDHDLAEMRGAALSPEILGIAMFDAISANNTSAGTISGGNIIDAGAFSDSSGLSTIIQNSGNNVLIQSAMILNVNID